MAMNDIDLYKKIASQTEVRPRFKIEILSQSEEAIGEISDDIIDGSININYNQGIYRSCSITFADPMGTYVPNSNGYFWINKKFKIYVGLEYSKYFFEDFPFMFADTIDNLILIAENNTLNFKGRNIMESIEMMWFPQGVFYITNPTSSRDMSNRTTTISGVDKFGIFGTELGYNQLEGTYLIKAGTNAMTAVRDILMLDMGNGYVIDSVEPIISGKLNEGIPFDIKKAPTGYLGDILKDIANMYGCDIFYDSYGRLNILDGTLDASYSEDSTIWDFTDVLPEYMNSSVTYDFVKAINCVKVVSTNINDKIYEATEENRNPLSNTNIDSIGKKIKYVESPNVYNQERANDYAKYILKKESIVPIAISFSSTMLPHLDVNKVVAINDSFYKYENERFIIQSLVIPLKSNQLLSITASNLASLPYYEATV